MKTARDKTAQEWQTEIYKWAKKNPLAISSSGHGIGEGMGLYLNLVLMDKTGSEGRKHMKEYYHLLGVVMILTLHWAEMNATFVSFDEAHTYTRETTEWNRDRVIGHIFQNLGRIFFVIDRPSDSTELRSCAQRLFNNVCALATIHGADDCVKDCMTLAWESMRRLMKAHKFVERSKKLATVAK